MVAATWIAQAAVTSDTAQSEREKDDMPAGAEGGDHAACVLAALDAADAHCKARGLRFTPVRRKVLELLLEERRALGAYALLDRLRSAGFGSQPPVAYRALDFLAAHGFVHKIERLNAFVACTHPGKHHSPAFMICRACDAVEEAHVVHPNKALGDAAREAGFQVERTVIEAEGLCSSCTDHART